MLRQGSRSRKVKCPGQRPLCSNCDKRQETCVYERTIRRRGPDRQPGGAFISCASSVALIHPKGRIKGVSVERRQIIETLNQLPASYDDRANARPRLLPTASVSTHTSRSIPYGFPPPSNYETGRMARSWPEREKRQVESSQVIHEPLYMPPGCVDEARENWWLWMLRLFAPEKDVAKQIIHSHCRQ